MSTRVTDSTATMVTFVLLENSYSWILPWLFTSPAYAQATHAWHRLKKMILELSWILYLFTSCSQLSVQTLWLAHARQGTLSSLLQKRFLLSIQSPIQVMIRYTYKLIFIWKLTSFRGSVELAQYAFGKKRGSLLLYPTQLIVLVGLAIVYTVTGGKALHSAWQ